MALAVVLGISAALFIYGYWLYGVFPAGSRLLLLLTALIAAVCVPGYAVLLRWLHRAFHELGFREAAVLLLASMFVGCTSVYSTGSMPSLWLPGSAWMQPLSIEAGESATQPVTRSGGSMPK